MQPIISQYIQKNALIIDVRTPEEFSGGHCQGSINIPLNLLSEKANELDPQRSILVCCASGGRSAMAQSLLSGKGFKDVVNAGAWTNIQKQCP